MVPIGLLALATSASNAGIAPPSTLGGIIGWILAYRRRREEIGGFLFMFFWQVYAGAIVSVFSFVINFHAYVPEFIDDRKLYYLLLASTVPGLITLAAAVVVATILLTVRSWDLLVLLRWIFVAKILLVILSLVIDGRYFTTAIGEDLSLLLLYGIWTAYLFRSRRVEHVFRWNNWDEVVGGFHPLQKLGIT